MVKNLPDNAGDTGDRVWIPGLRRSSGVGNGSPLQYSCLENPMDRESWRTTVHGVTKNWTWDWLSMPTAFHCVCVCVYVCVCIAHYLDPFICQWTFRLLLCLGYESFISEIANVEAEYYMLHAPYYTCKILLPCIHFMTSLIFLFPRFWIQFKQMKSCLKF